jgi:1,4-alpha-glucan branching enzyme
MRAVSVLSLLVALLTAPPDVKASSDGQYEVFFHYQAPAGTKTVFLAGEFNNWKTDAQKMDGPDGKGLFTTKLTLKPGRYEYKYVLEGKTLASRPGEPAPGGLFPQQCPVSTGAG